MCQGEDEPALVGRDRVDLMRNGVPVVVAAFVGRERERAKVADLVSGPGW